MKSSARVIIAIALLSEFVLALFPPMRLTMMDAGTGFTMGRTEHHFVFARTAGGWIIDGGRFMVYTVVIAVATGLALFVTNLYREDTAA